MTDDRESRIRQRAYSLWESEGCPEGRHVDHWRQAEQEVGQDDDLTAPAAAGGAAATQAQTGAAEATRISSRRAPAAVGVGQQSAEMSDGEARMQVGGAG